MYFFFFQGFGWKIIESHDYLIHHVKKIQCPKYYETKAVHKTFPGAALFCTYLYYKNSPGGVGGRRRKKHHVIMRNKSGEIQGVELREVRKRKQGQHLVSKGKDGCVDIRQLRRLLHLLVSGVHLPVLDVVSVSELCYFLNTHKIAIFHVDHAYLIVSLKSTVSCGTTPMAALRLAWLKVLTSWPSNITLPSVTSNRRNNSLATVVLPLPELEQKNESYPNCSFQTFLQELWLSR